MKQPAGRRGKELFEVTRPLAKESRFKSWWYVISTFVVLGLLLAGAGLAPWWPLRLVLGLIGGFVLVRAFVLYHDFMHGAILRDSRLGKIAFYAYGLVALTPPRYWRYSHNYHHAHVSKPIPAKKGIFSLLTADVGTMPLMTTEMWRQATFGQRLQYRVSRHPLTILGAYITVFFFSVSLVPTLKNPRKFWDGALSLLVHIGLIATIWALWGFPVVFFACFVPFATASALGAYLFFAQHNFEDLQILSADRWSHFDASLDSSSYMKLGPIGNWLTANIGYHHVHHLNALIPFYRLPEAMATIPELQHPLTTTLHPREVWKCLRLSLWDEQQQHLVTFHQAARA
jgi:omega-6 fatty acid desaturase (delta-12 desaturase)